MPTDYITLQKTHDRYKGNNFNNKSTTPNTAKYCAEGYYHSCFFHIIIEVDNIPNID